MATQITATLPTLDFPKEVDYPTQEDWAAFSAAAELNFGILGGSWSTQMQLWKTEANLMSTELNTNATIAQGLANYKGDWISQGYTLGQTVSVSGVYYICKLTHATGQNPTTGGSIYWNLAIGNWNLKVNTDMSGYISKPTPVDSDLIPLSDSDSSFGIKKLSWAKMKDNLFNGAKSLTTNGYIKLPTTMGGLIIQWGSTATANIEGPVSVSFPISFPNQVLKIVATKFNDSGLNDDCWVTVQSYVLGGVVFRIEAVTGGNFNGNRYIEYIAIGY